MKEFEKFVMEHSILPKNNMYNTIALCGESGEVANVIKKIEIRNALKPSDVISMKTMDDYKTNLKEELGDVLFYLTTLSLNNGLTLEDLINNQIEKIKNQEIEYNRTFLK